MRLSDDRLGCIATSTASWSDGICGRPENFVLMDGAGREVDLHVFDLGADGNGR